MVGLYSYPCMHVASMSTALAAMILSITEVMLDPDDDPLSVTVTINELCLSDRGYLVLVSFGTRPANSNGDCEVQGEVNATISSGCNVTFSIPTDTISLGTNEEYCYLVTVNDTIGEYIHLCNKCLLCIHT